MTHKHTLLLRNIIWAIIIFILCTMPGDSLPNPNFTIPYLDKIVHFGMFFIMAIFLCSELNYQTPLRGCHIYLITSSVCFAYGGIIELLQHQFFHRSGEWWDLVADLLGAAMGCLFYPTAKRIKDKLLAYLKKIITKKTHSI